MKPTLAFVLAATMLASPAAAQKTGETIGETIRQDDRYALIVVDDGYIRLDTQSGEVARCTGKPDTLTCRLAADERLAYVSEIERLETRLDELEARMGALEAERAERPLADSRRYGLPSDEELDEVMTMTDKVFRRFFGLVRELKRDIEQDQL